MSAFRSWILGKEGGRQPPILATRDFDLPTYALAAAAAIRGILPDPGNLTAR